MVKESSSRDSSIKKRRSKSNVAGDGDQDVDVYKKSVAFEEKEALSRQPEDDAKIFFETCENIRKILFELLELKSQKSPEAKAKIKEKSTEACLLLTVLKKLNRYDKFRCLAARDVLAAEKQKVDSTNLQYQNLLYEADHLMSEFNKCRQFKSKDESIELIPVEQFLKEAPEYITKHLQTKEGDPEAMEHELYLARLEYELTQRKNLAELCKSFENEKKELATKIVELKDRLEGLAPRLHAVLEATKPLQEHLGLPIDKTRAEHKLALLLPDPLYLLYANIDAYKNVYKLDVGIEILGDQDEANQWKEQENTVSNDADDEIEQDNDSQEAEESVEVKKRRHRKSSHLPDRHEEKKNKLLQVHPLSVEITFNIKDGPVLKIKVFYYTCLKIVAVKSQVTIPSNITGNTAREVLQGESMVGELLEGDFGTDSPNPGNNYQLQKVGLGSYASLVHKLGYAYSWAQRVCGINFLATQMSRSSMNKLSQTNVEIIMKLLRTRLKSRTALAKQLQQLDQNLIPIIPDTVEYPRNAVSTLTKWTNATWQQVCQSPVAESLLENEIISPSDLFYGLSIARPTAILQAYVVIKNSYPTQAPIFLLNLNYNGSRHAANCDEIRDMERAVNVGWNHGMASADWLLSVQLRHLCAFLDVYLETTVPDNFPQSTVFFKNVCGRNHRRPFKFRKIGAGIFTQY